MEVSAADCYHWHPSHSTVLDLRLNNLEIVSEVQVAFYALNEEPILFSDVFIAN